MIRSRRLPTFAGVAAATLLAIGASFPSPAVAAPGIVTTHTGARFEGDVTERTNDVVVTIRGVQTIVDRVDVASIDYTDFDRQFRDRVSKLEPNDIESRLELARWAMQKQEYGAARDTLEVVLQLDPNNLEATELMTLVRGQLRLEARNREQQPSQRSPATRPAAAATTRPADVEEPQAAPPQSRRLLSPDEVQSIRRAEWRPGDVVRVRVDTRAARQFASDTNTPWREFAGRRAGAQAEAILSNGRPEHRRGVQVLTDPPVIAEFRRAVQPIVLSGCATSGCHGGPSPTTAFALVSPADNEAATYTNFYLLMTASRQLDVSDVGGGGGGSRTIFGGQTDVSMIERGDGARSLLIQYALPPEIATHDHPPVQNFRPLFQSLADARARAVVAWIDSLSPIVPEYGFTFSLSPQIEGMTGDESAAAASAGEAASTTTRPAWPPFDLPPPATSPSDK